MKYLFGLALCFFVLALAGNGFAQTQRYAAGTTIIHRIEGGSLEYLDPSKPIKVEIQRKVEDSSGSRWKTGEPRIKIIKVTPLGHGTAGVSVKMVLHRDAWKNSEKQLLITGRHKDDGRELSFVQGRFSVVPLKTVIIAVDGLGYQSIKDVLASEGEMNFKKVFAEAVNRDSPALSALPTITFTNWPGIFGGRPPKDHGILGNSFFEREKAGNIRGLETREPFASNGISANRSNLSVVRGELDNRVRIEASLYDRVAEVLGRRINVWSINGFYALTKRPHVNITTTHYGGDVLEPTDLAFSGHNPATARRLDTDSGDRAAEVLIDHIDELDMLTVYFPGPDNVAHAIGDKESADGFTPGPSRVDVPLDAIKQQIYMVTDHELGRVVDALEQSGYLNATLFVLVSDHGLHAYRNDRLHNIYLPEQRNTDTTLPAETRRRERAGLENFFTTMGLKVWRGSDINSKTLVYSPNGGMAHIYIRNMQEEDGELKNAWNTPPRKKDIEMVARQLFVEAMGGKRHLPCPRPTVAERDALESAMRETGCYAGLTKLNGALGNPPAIFARVGTDDSVNNFTQDFRWLKNVQGTIPSEIEYGSIDEFIRARSNVYAHFDWPAFAERMEEMNDTRPDGSRTGDIVLFTDGRAGYLTINESDGLNGWHGGATVAESYVPLMFNFPGSAVDKRFKEGLIRPALDTAASRRRSQTLRNWDLREIMGNIYGNLNEFEYSMEDAGETAPKPPTGLRSE